MVSIIIPVYNVEKYLKRCLDSVTNQTYKDIEIILVDDGSIDNSASLCDYWLKKDNRIKVIHKTNGGPSDTRNKGLDIICGEYLQFVDSDDYIDRNTIEITMNNINDLVMYNYNRVNGGTIERDITIVNKTISKEDFFINWKEHINTAYLYKIYNKVYKTAIIKENSINFPLDIKIGEDLRFNLAYLSKVNSVSCINNNLYNYVTNNKSSLMNTVGNVDNELVLREIDDVRMFLLNNIFDKEEAVKAIDCFTLDKLLVVINNTNRTKKSNKEIFNIICSKYKISNFDNFKYTLLLEKAYKSSNYSLLELRCKLIIIRYRLIKLIKGIK